MYTKDVQINKWRLHLKSLGWLMTAALAWLGLDYDGSSRPTTYARVEVFPRCGTLHRALDSRLEYTIGYTRETWRCNALNRAWQVVEGSINLWNPSQRIKHLSFDVVRWQSTGSSWMKTHCHDATYSLNLGTEYIIPLWLSSLTNIIGLRTNMHCRVYWMGPMDFKVSLWKRLY